MSGATRLDAAAARLQTDDRLELWFDVSPMFDEQWTGIPVVAGALAGLLMGAVPRARYFFESSEIQPGAVADALRRNSGVFLAPAFFEGRAVAGPMLPATDRLSIGINPSSKRIRGVFDVECSVVHDLSTLITPQFHTADNIDHHMQVMAADLVSNDVTFCVSDAVRDDVIAYLGLDPGLVQTTHNGVAWPDRFPLRFWNELGAAEIEPYLLMLGTREPRKNIARVLDCVERSPGLLDRCRLVIAGRAGWLQETQPSRPALARAIDEGRIVFTGYVTEYEKYKLLAGARATIYPSFFEGFGLPVLESLSVGTPCVASFSSSLPEAGGPACVYFDPFSISDLNRALHQVLDEDPDTRAARRAACRQQAALFTWEKMLAAMLTRLIEIADRKLG